MIEYSWLIPTLPALTYVVIILFTSRYKVLSGLLSILTMLTCFGLSVGILLEVLAKAKSELPDAEVVILTGHSTVKTAVNAMQAGATTFLAKPLDINELRIFADKASQSHRLARTNLALQRQLNEKFGFEGVIGSSAVMHVWGMPAADA